MTPAEYFALRDDLLALRDELTERVAQMEADGCAATCENPEKVDALGVRFGDLGARARGLAATQPEPEPEPAGGDTGDGQ